MATVVHPHYSEGVGFWWALGALEWLARAGIEPYEVMQVLAYARRWPRPARTPAGGALTIWGRTRTGRALLVVLWPERGTVDHQITLARELTADEETQLQAWEATRDER